MVRRANRDRWAGIRGFSHFGAAKDNILKLIEDRLGHGSSDFWLLEDLIFKKCKDIFICPRDGPSRGLGVRPWRGHSRRTVIEDRMLYMRGDSMVRWVVRCSILDRHIYPRVMSSRGVNAAVDRFVTTLRMPLGLRVFRFLGRSSRLERGKYNHSGY